MNGLINFNTAKDLVLMISNSDFSILSQIYSNTTILVGCIEEALSILLIKFNGNYSY